MSEASKRCQSRSASRTVGMQDDSFLNVMRLTDQADCGAFYRGLADAAIWPLRRDCRQSERPGLSNRDIPPGACSAGSPAALPVREARLAHRWEPRNPETIRFAWRLRCPTPLGAGG